MGFKVVTGALGSAVVDTGTFTASYPANTDEGDFYLAMGHKLSLGNNDSYSFPGDFDITLGTADVTVTNRSGVTWPAGTAYRLQLEMQGKTNYRLDNGLIAQRAVMGHTLLINLGAPDVLDVDGVAAAQAIAGAQAVTINGALASGGVATMDRPRALEIDSSDAGDTTQTVTITGKDEYGVTITETIAANGTTAVAGKKAFKTVTGAVTSAAFTGNLTIGTTDLLGLPVFVPSAGMILKELLDGVAATAGTLVGGIRTANGSTATTGDVRGTYDPNAAADGARVFQIIVFVPDSGSVGIAQA